MSAACFLSTGEAAEYLGFAEQTLRSKRIAGDGPPFIKLGDGRSSRCVYRVTDLERWLLERTRTSTTAGRGSARS